MSKSLLSIVLMLAAAPALAQGMRVEDPYARATSPMAGAAFMEIVNETESDDRLVGVKTPVAERAEIHTHEQSDAGVMRMIHVEQGLPLAAGETLSLARGGDHVMLTGFEEMPRQGDRLTLTLTFEQAGEVTVEVPVDNERQPGGHAE